MRRLVLVAALLVACGEDEPMVDKVQTEDAQEPAMRSLTALQDTTIAQSFVLGKDTVRIGLTLKHVPDTVTDTIFVHDSIVVPPPQIGVDTIVSGDTTRYAFWSMKKVVDSVKVVVKPPPTPVGEVARWGPSGFFGGTSATSPTSALGKFTYAANENATRDDWLMDDIAEARQRKVPVMLAFPCGSHTWPKIGNCIDTVTKAFSMTRFDSALTKKVLKNYVRPEVVQAYKDGIVVGAQIIDEPWVHADPDDDEFGGNSWGPPGTITKARADTLCRKTQMLIPGVPVGMNGHLTAWEPSKDVKVCDYLQYQYSYRFGSVTTWRDAVKAQGKRGGYQIQFSLNIINGGTQDKDGTWDCKDQGGRRGNRTPNCQMTPAQVETVVKALAPHSHGGLMMWRYDDSRYASTAYLDMITRVLAWLKTQKQPKLTVR